MKKILVAAIVVSVFLIRPAVSGAAPLGDADVTVAIDKDQATILWSLPCQTSSNKAIASGSYKDLGQTRFSIDFVSATANGKGAYLAPIQGGDDQDLTMYCGEGGTRATFVYTTKSTVNGGAMTVELPVYYNTYTFDSANVRVKVPPGLVFLSASEPYKTDGGDITFRFQGQREADYLLAKDLLLVFAKNPVPAGYEHKKIGPYDIYALSRSMRLIEKMEPYMLKLQDFFKETLGLDLSEHTITVTTADLKPLSSKYEAGGMAMYKNKLILLDADNLAVLPTVDVVKMLVHETTHILMGYSGIFSNEPVSIPWMDEGLAVFNEEYFADKFLGGTPSQAAKNDYITGYAKFSTTTLAEQYKNQFDAFFIRTDHIADSYSHAGLVFYKAFLDDPKIVSNFILELRKENVDHYCDSCTSRRAQVLLAALENRSEEDTFYPLKGETDIPAKYAVLFRQNVDEATGQKINREIVTGATQYFASTTTVLPAKTPSVPKKAATTTPISAATSIAALRVGTSSSATSTAIETAPQPIASEATATTTAAVPKAERSAFETIFFAPARAVEFLMKLFSK